MPAAMPAGDRPDPTAIFRCADFWRPKLPAGATDQILWDPELPGFGVRLRATKATYLVQYRFQKATQRESIGDVRKLKLEEARKVARQFFAKLELGIDPRAEKRKAEEAAEVARLTFKTVADLYLKAKEAHDASEHLQGGRGLLRRQMGAVPSQADQRDSTVKPLPSGCAESSRSTVPHPPPGPAGTCRPCSPGR